MLRVDYRDTAEILAAATGVVAGDRFCDLEGTEEAGAGDCETVRRGSAPTRVRARDLASHDAAMLTALREACGRPGSRPGDVAVLAAGHAVLRGVKALLASAGVRWVDLEDYDGRPSPAVKVGTVERAKGVEFACVLLPQVDAALLDGGREPADRERVERERRELFVGMTRARDGLWIGSVVPRGTGMTVRTGASPRTALPIRDVPAGCRTAWPCMSPARYRSTSTSTPSCRYVVSARRSRVARVRPCSRALAPTRAS